jgi:hypothetical protein
MQAYSRIGASVSGLARSKLNQLDRFRREADMVEGVEEAEIRASRGASFILRHVVWARPRR